MIKLMYQKIKTLLERYGVIDFILRLQDIRFAGLVVFVIVVLLISWSGVKAIETNYQLQKQISTLQQQTAVQRLKNTNLQLQNQYYNTNQYLELSARQNYGLAAPGETELIVPKDVALAHTVPEPTAKVAAANPSDKQPFYQKNFQAWVNFFLHRS
jgi:cell division protein FtsB